MQPFVEVQFHRFKAFKDFKFRIRHFNILVGPNNAGKSTILTAFRILAAAMRVGASRRAIMIKGPNGRVFGHGLDLSAISVAEENIFFDYNDSNAAWVKFTLANGNILTLYFPEIGYSYLIAENARGLAVETPKAVREAFPCPIGFVPILGPVEHKEPLFLKEAAHRALFSYHAARNFRNIWHHFPQKFEEFRTALQQTWPGMDIERPQVDTSHDKPLLHMFCPEARVPREIFWAGFGFQVWCQMLTHLIQSSEKSIFLIDEPDIYLHSDLQRQLLHLLRNLGPDIVIATHSTEIVAEAEPDDIVLVNKKQANATRIKRPAQLAGVFAALGSNLNPILTQLAKTRRVVFVEGTDFQILSRFAAKCGFDRVASRSDFSVVPSGGFNPERAKSLREGMAMTLGAKVRAAIIFDRDFRSDDEVEEIKADSSKFCDLVEIHQCKEIENFLLVPMAIDRAADRKLKEREKRTGKSVAFTPCAEAILWAFADEQKPYVLGQTLACFRAFGRVKTPGKDDATTNQAAYVEFEARWGDPAQRLRMLPGKEALSAVNKVLQDKYDISLTPTSIIDAMKVQEVPADMRVLLGQIETFSKLAPVE